MSLQTRRWVRLLIGPKQRGISKRAHLIDGEMTACGLWIGDRLAPGQPPAGAARCRLCEVHS